MSTKQQGKRVVRIVDEERRRTIEAAKQEAPCSAAGHNGRLTKKCCLPFFGAKMGRGIHRSTLNGVLWVVKWHVRDFWTSKVIDYDGLSPIMYPP